MTCHVAVLFLATVAHGGAQEISSRANTPAEALNLLKQGNERARNPRVRHRFDPNLDRTRLAAGQAPFAAILSCSDSRVPPEMIFDQQPGDLFIVRLAGNVADESALGSLEYAVEHLHAKAILVMGHSECGAIKASMMSPPQLAKLPASLRHLLKLVDHGMSGSTVPATVQNVRSQMKAVAADPVVKEAVSHGHVLVSGAYYDILTGKVIPVK